MNNPLFSPIDPYRTGKLAVDEPHVLYWEECGNPDGTPVLFLHGGPGSGASPTKRQFFDPGFYRTVLFDQRGANRSIPLGEWRQNTTTDLIADIEKLRTMLGISRWLVCGGSWGSTLALAYGQAHPDRCDGFILRGIYLGTSPEIDWFLNGIRLFFPEFHAEFAEWIPEPERMNILSAYQKRLFSSDPQLVMEAAKRWNRYATSCSSLIPDPEEIEQASTSDNSLGTGRIHAHYFLHNMFLEDDQLIKNMHRIADIPSVIVQGRYDVICPPASAYRLHQAWPKSVLRMIPDAGHSPSDPGIESALVEATQQFKLHRSFNPHAAS
jgi:proline iminopeptidase